MKQKIKEFLIKEYGSHTTAKIFRQVVIVLVTGLILALLMFSGPWKPEPLPQDVLEMNMSLNLNLTQNTYPTVFLVVEDYKGQIACRIQNNSSIWRCFGQRFMVNMSNISLRAYNASEGPIIGFKRDYLITWIPNNLPGGEYDISMNGFSGNQTFATKKQKLVHHVYLTHGDIVNMTKEGRL